MDTVEFLIIILVIIIAISFVMFIKINELIISQGEIKNCLDELKATMDEKKNQNTIN